MLSELITAVRNADFYSLIGVIASAAILILVCLPIHEWAHAYTAHLLGDDTAKYQGRMTINPMRHIDLFGSLMIILAGIGFAKPVPVNMNNFKNRKKGMALVALAGPMSNLIMGVFFSFIYALILVISSSISFSSEISLKTFYIIYIITHYAASINISLAVFNLIHVPPFDGSRILGFFLPDRIYYKIMQYEQIIFIVVFLLLFLGFFDGPLSLLMNGAFEGIVGVFVRLLGGTI